MSFATWYYPFFIAAVAVIFWALPSRYRGFFMIPAAFVFYGYWDIRFIALLMAAAGVDYLSALQMAGQSAGKMKAWLIALMPLAWLCIARFFKRFDLWELLLVGLFCLAFIACYEFWSRQRGPRRKRAFLGLAVGFNLALLGFFKYAAWFAEGARDGLRAVGVEADWATLNIVLPVGISFHTFQSVAYAVDVYHGKCPAEPSFRRILNMISFFPQLVAGPIERASHLLPQLAFSRPFDWRKVAWGLHLILAGFFLKVFVADNCAIVANYYFDSVHSGANLGGGWTLVGTLAFAFQIYGDFSGYSYIARGSAMLLGVELTRNFRLPYFATSPSDFWRRWHISLSSWFRDYVYIPLGGSRGSEFRTAINLLVTMLLAGLWHGASAMFVAWGAYHGALQAIWRASPGLERLGRANTLIARVLAITLTFALICIGWILFRAKSFPDLLVILQGLGIWQAPDAPGIAGAWNWLAFHVVPLLGIQLAVINQDEESDIVSLPMPLLVPIYLITAIGVLSSGYLSSQFIYFQF
jgi:D-alanyl-lipoteichoic acid acyltransferase DltB (MBOAT superfamily)